MSDNPDPPADQSGEVYDDEGWPEEPDDQMIMRHHEAEEAEAELSEAEKTESEAPPDEAGEASGESEDD